MVFLLFSLFLTVHVAAASCFVNLVIKESDNNVKLIVLDRLDTLRAKHGHVLDGLIMDVLQVLSRFQSISLLYIFSLTSNTAPTWKYAEKR